MIPKDIGLFVGRYFQVLGVLSLASSALALMLGNQFNVNLTFLIFLWAAGHLKRHNETARKWTLRVTGALMAIVSMFPVFSAVPHRHTVHLMGWSVEDPAFWQMAAVTGAGWVVLGVPFGLLLTPQAQEEFGGVVWQFSLRKFFVVITLVALVSGAVGGVRRLYYVQVSQVRAVLDEYPEIDRVWIGTNDDVVLEVEKVFFTVNNRPGAIFQSGGIDYVGEAEFRRRLDQALRERREVELPDYAMPLDR
jgi:hypothetical protein